MNKESKYLIIRVLFFIVGIVSLILGTIGVILPIVPTVPFYLLASYCFVKSSDRFNKWFISTKLYIKYVSGFTEHKTMSLKGELTMLILVSIMLIIAMLMVDVLPMTICINILLFLKYLYFITTVKTVSSSELESIKSKNKLEEDSLCQQV